MACSPQPRDKLGKGGGKDDEMSTHMREKQTGKEEKEG